MAAEGIRVVRGRRMTGSWLTHKEGKWLAVLCAACLGVLATSPVCALMTENQNGELERIRVIPIDEVRPGVTLECTSLDLGSLVIIIEGTVTDQISEVSENSAVSLPTPKVNEAETELSPVNGKNGEFTFVVDVKLNEFGPNLIVARAENILGYSGFSSVIATVEKDEVTGDPTGVDCGTGFERKEIRTFKLFGLVQNALEDRNTFSGTIFSIGRATEIGRLTATFRSNARVGLEHAFLTDPFLAVRRPEDPPAIPASVPAGQ